MSHLFLCSDTSKEMQHGARCAVQVHPTFIHVLLDLQQFEGTPFSLSGICDNHPLVCV